MTSEQQALAGKIRNSAWKDYLNEKRWCAWFVGDPKPDGDGFAKVPRGSHSDPATWDTFDDVCRKLKPGDGFGYNFLGGDLHPLDLDHVRNPITGLICNEAMLLLSRLQSFSEVSISGRGLHVLFRGNVRGHQLSETCVQYWNPAKAPRFFTVTADVVGEAFSTVKDVGDDFNFVFATAAHISAKCREELRAIDYDQWAKLPAEPVRTKVEKEKAKTKSRKLHKDFNIVEFLKFYELPVDNVTKNDIGTCYRLTTCPIKGEPHVGQNSTSTNFILSTDGGLGFKCQSTGCVEYSVSQVIEKLAKDKGAYPKPIYEEKTESGLIYQVRSLADVEEVPLCWLWPDYLPLKQLVHLMGASSEGKSPVSHDVIARITTGQNWPDGSKNVLGPRSVILMSAEDNLQDTVKPRIRLAGGDTAMVKLFEVLKRNDDLQTPIAVAIDRDMDGLRKMAKSIDDLALIVIDPITNYLGKAGMNKEEEIRAFILMPLVDLARECDCSVVTIGHLNKREAATVLQKGMGATAFTGVPRKVFLFGGDPEDSDKYTHVMQEIRDKQVALKYRTEKVVDPEGKQTSGIIRVNWLGQVERDADEVVNQPKSREKTSNAEAKAVIKTLLTSGRKTTDQIIQALKDAGVECPAWQRIARRIPAKPEQVGKVWHWGLVVPEQTTFDGGVPKEIER